MSYKKSGRNNSNCGISRVGYGGYNYGYGCNNNYGGYYNSFNNCGCGCNNLWILIWLFFLCGGCW